jgi:hypothetical protein
MLGTPGSHDAAVTSYSEDDVPFNGDGFDVERARHTGKGAIGESIGLVGVGDDGRGQGVEDERKEREGRREKGSEPIHIAGWCRMADFSGSVICLFGSDEWSVGQQNPRRHLQRPPETVPTK